jgi:hypothetical protein
MTPAFCYQWVSLYPEETGMPTIKELRATYAQLPDAELCEIAVREARVLSDDATQVLREEMGRRGLLAPFENSISVQRRTLNREEVDEMIRQVRQLPCPSCKVQGLPLNGCIMETHGKDIFYLGCRDCIRSAARKENAASLASGILHLPLGPFFGFITVFYNRKAAGVDEWAEPTQEFIDYVRENPGHFTLLLEQHQRAAFG